MARLGWWDTPWPLSTPIPLAAKEKQSKVRLHLKVWKSWVCILSLLIRPFQINLDLPDLEKFPLFKEATVEHCILSPGEMLFIPAFYWHQVRLYLARSLKSTTTRPAVGGPKTFWEDQRAGDLKKRSPTPKFTWFLRFLLSAVGGPKQILRTETYRSVWGKLVFRTLIEQTQSTIPQRLIDFQVVNWKPPSIG